MQVRNGGGLDHRAYGGSKGELVRFSLHILKVEHTGITGVFYVGPERKRGGRGDS